MTFCNVDTSNTQLPFKIVGLYFGKISAWISVLSHFEHFVMLVAVLQGSERLAAFHVSSRVGNRPYSKRKVSLNSVNVIITFHERKNAYND